MFFSTCAQVAFIYEAFCKLNVGCSILRLTSRMSQNSRQETFYEFRKQKYGYLLTTDVAARGVDIPDVQTVIQFDCPTSVQEYQHRCGRCTRMSRIGMSVLFLPSCECFFKKELEKAQLPFEDRHVKLRNAVSVRDALCMTVASDARLKALSELALKSYYRSLMSQKDKRVFRIPDYDFNKISQSYGLEMQVQMVDEDVQEAQEEVQEESDDILVQKDGQEEASEHEEEAAPQQDHKLSAEELNKQLAGRLSKLQHRVASHDQRDRTEYKDLMKKMKEGVNEESESGNEESSHEQDEEQDDADQGEEFEDVCEWEEPEPGDKV